MPKFGGQVIYPSNVYPRHHIIPLVKKHIRQSSWPQPENLNIRAHFTTNPSLVNEIADTWHQRAVWLAWGANDVRQRYRRSALGPLWYTLNVAILSVTLAALYSTLLKHPFSEFVVHVTVGLVIWTFIATSINEFASMFIVHEAQIKQIRTSYLALAARVQFRNILVLAHHAVLVIVVWIVFSPHVVPEAFHLFIGCLLLMAFVGACGLLSAILSTRFRDLPQLINAVLGLAMMVSPVIWKVSDLPGSSLFLVLNPFYYLLEVVRGPLLGASPPFEMYLTTIAISVATSLAAIYTYKRKQARIIYWL